MAVLITKLISDVNIGTVFARVPYKTYGSVRFNHQAQFHPRKYLCALARKIEGGCCYIFEKTRAMGVEGRNPVVGITDKGTARADYVIQVTYFPIFDKKGELFNKLSQSLSNMMEVV